MQPPSIQKPAFQPLGPRQPEFLDVHYIVEVTDHQNTPSHRGPQRVKLIIAITYGCCSPGVNSRIEYLNAPFNFVCYCTLTDTVVECCIVPDVPVTVIS